MSSFLCFYHLPFWQQLHNYGGRKFVVVGVGPIGCCPGERYKNKTEECEQDINSASVKYNQGLKSMLQELQSEFKDINYSFFDTYTVLLDIIQKPASYGNKQNYLINHDFGI